MSKKNKNNKNLQALATDEQLPQVRSSIPVTSRQDISFIIKNDMFIITTADGRLLNIPHPLFAAWVKAAVDHIPSFLEETLNQQEVKTNG